MTAQKKPEALEALPAINGLLHQRISYRLLMFKPKVKMKVAKNRGFYKSCYAGWPTKIYQVMRLTALFLFAACLEVQAHGYSQGKLTLAEKDAPLPKVFQAIERQSDYHFFYDYPLLQGAGRVDVKVKNASLDDVLKICFKGQGFTYSVVGKMVTVVENKETGAPVPAGNGVPGVIAEFKGRVTNESGEPLQGATVEVQGAKKGTFTDEKGSFTFKNIPADAVLEISFTGYQKTVVNLSGTSTLGIILKVATNELDQVQIIAYGTTTQRLNTGDVSTVTSKEIEEQPVSNPLTALEGRVPGMFITQNTGLPGGSVTVEIRGQNSIANGNDPFYIIDGVPYSSELLLNNNINPAGGNPLNFINPSDIESIDILKDADATAIYGSRGANGVVLITTKKGKAGNARINISMYTGNGKITREPNYLSTPQYLEMRREAFSNDNVSPGATDYDVNGTWDTTRYTDWQKMLIGGTATYSDAQASISGGNNSIQYVVGGGYHRETTVFPGNLSDQKASAHIGLNGASSNNRFKYQFSANYVNDFSNLIVSDITSEIENLPPDAPTVYNSDGSLNWANSTWPSGNPFAIYKQTYSSNSPNLISSSNLAYSILPNLNLKLNLGYNDMLINENELFPISSYDPAYGVTSGSSSFNTSEIKSWIVEPQANYFINFNKMKVDALIGSTFEESTTNARLLAASGFSSDALLENSQFATSISSFTTYAQYKYDAIFGRVNLDWDHKYLVNLTARRDGSSRFGPASQFSNFGAAGIGWIFSEEQFIKKNFKPLTFGKLRASYGITGNDQIGDYRFIDLYSGTSYPYQGTQGLYPTNLFNPNLQWETNKKIEGGIDLGFFENRLSLNLSYYQNRSSNQLVQSPLSSVTGFTSISANLPALVQNTGVEVKIGSKIVNARNFNWFISVNLTVPKNKLLAYPNLSTSTYQNIYIVGQALTIRREIKFAGVNDTTGIYQFYGSHGEITSSPSYPADLSTYTNTAPRYYGGISNKFQYKNLTLDLLFQFVNQKGMYFLYNFLPGFEGLNQPTSVINRWHIPEENTNIQKYTETFGSVYQAYNYAYNYSNEPYGNASYVRLKNLSLSYELPYSWRKKVHLQDCQFFIQGQNLLTFTKYVGYDPENQSSSVLPPLKVITGGFRLTL